MNYYRLYNSLIVSEIGCYPQVNDAEVDFDIYNKNSAYHLHFAKANPNTLWPVSKLSKKAKKTDLISVSFLGLSNKLLISEKLYSIVSKSHYDDLQFIESRLITKDKKEHEYWIVNPYKNSIANLDPRNSLFSYLKTIGSNERIEPIITFKDSNELTEAFEKNKMNAKLKGIENHTPLVIDKVSLRNDLIVDIFALSPTTNGGIGFFVSEKLKNEIENAGCTGIVFTEPNEKYP